MFGSVVMSPESLLDIRRLADIHLANLGIIKCVNCKHMCSIQPPSASWRMSYPGIYLCKEQYKSYDLPLISLVEEKSEQVHYNQRLAA